MGQAPHPILIRPASVDDLDAIRRIRNHYVLQTTITYEEIVWTSDDARGWFDGHAPTHAVTVAELAGDVIGYGAFGLFRPQSGYKFTVEHSVYVAPAHHRRGIGSALLGDLIDRARNSGYRVMVAVIDSEQAPSIALHARFGFVKTGQLNQVGFKSGKLLDAVFMQLSLSAENRK